MSDYGRKLELGASFEPLADPPDWMAGMAKAADEAGLDLLGIQDHPYQRRFLDTWKWIKELARLMVEIGFDTFVYWPQEDHVKQIKLFAGEVAPGVREAVEKGRA